MDDKIDVLYLENHEAVKDLFLGPPEIK